MGRRADRVNVEWGTHDPLSVEIATIEVLMDIRTELRRLNALLHCGNFTAIPHRLERIARNTSRPKKKRARS